MTDANLIHSKLENARRDLLDLTTRNRLISTARSSTRSGRLEIEDELAEEVFRILVQEKKAMSFLARPKESEEDGDATGGELLFQPEDDDDQEDSDALAERHVDRNLQTAFTSEQPVPTARPCPRNL